MYSITWIRGRKLYSCSTPSMETAYSVYHGMMHGPFNHVRLWHSKEKNKPSLIL